jgi:hypothetical protein
MTGFWRMRLVPAVLLGLLALPAGTFAAAVDTCPQPGSKIAGPHAGDLAGEPASSTYQNSSVEAE